MIPNIKGDFNSLKLYIPSQLRLSEVFVIMMKKDNKQTTNIKISPDLFQIFLDIIHRKLGLNDIYMISKNITRTLNAHWSWSKAL